MLHYLPLYTYMKIAISGRLKARLNFMECVCVKYWIELAWKNAIGWEKIARDCKSNLLRFQITDFDMSIFSLHPLNMYVKGKVSAFEAEKSMSATKWAIKWIDSKKK